MNANPPWGLHELAPANPARVSAAWSVRGRRTLLRALSARNLAPQSVVRVRCAGWRCPFGTLTLRPSGDAVDLRAALGDGAGRLRPGQTLEVAVSSHAYNGTVTRWRIRAGRAPTPSRLCVPLGNTAATPLLTLRRAASERAASGAPSFSTFVRAVAAG